MSIVQEWNTRLINCYSPVLPSQPLAPFHLRLKLSQPRSIIVRFSFEKRKVNTQKNSPLCPSPLSPVSHVLEFPTPLLCCDDKGTVTLDLGESKNKQHTTQIKTDLCSVFLSLYLSPQPRSPVRKENQTKCRKKKLA